MPSYPRVEESALPQCFQSASTSTWSTSLRFSKQVPFAIIVMFAIFIELLEHLIKWMILIFALVKKGDT